MKSNKIRVHMGSIPKQQILSMYRDMLFIRRFEEAVAELLERGEIHCPCHLYIGQEAVAVGVCSALQRDDWVFSTHRSHGHYLAKHGAPTGLMAELFCREGGCSRGRGGSMHIADLEAGLPGSCAIVGGTIPLAVGAAYKFKQEGNGRVVVVFMGDGAACEGVFYESLNLASIWEAPILFVLENNLYSTHMRVDSIHSDVDFVKKSNAFGVPAVDITGQSVVSVFRSASWHIDELRKGNGPFLMEVSTYRWRGHVGPKYDIDKGLRTQSELDYWMEHCPISMLRHDLLKKGWNDEVKTIGELVDEDVQNALCYAMETEQP